MLETQQRKLFLDSLQPPFGYQLDYLIGTSYSLDLLAFMTVPLSFTMLDWQDADGRPSMNPLALLEAMRRYSDKMVLFCQSGMIKIPKRHRSIFAYTEASIIEVKAPNDHGVFHPKVWVARYISKDESTRYKLIVQSRNLTFDRSWDMMLVLDGEVINRKNAFAKNHPLGDFLKALPELAIHDVSSENRQKIDLIQNEIRRVQFEIPEPFHKDSITFWPLGVPGHQKWPFADRHDRSLVVSPFISESFLQKFAQKGRGHILVTRFEEFGKTSPESLQTFEKIYVLQETSLPEPDEGNADEENASGQKEQDSNVEHPSSSPENEGLHAKFYIADQGWDASVWLGSANATTHAFEKNVEFLVELQGRKSRCGIDAFLGSPETKGSFSQLLQEYRITEHEVDADSLEREKWEKILETIRIQIASENFYVVVEETPDQKYYLNLHIPPLHWHKDAMITCWPLSMKEQFAGMPLKINKEQYSIRFGPVEAIGITSYFAFSISIPYGKEEISVRFLCNFPLQNEPENRKEQVLYSMLKNKEQLLRYLMLLLADGGLNISDLDTLLQGESENPTTHGENGQTPFPLFEMMMKALTRNPEQLDQIHKLVEDLKKTEEGRALLPDEFESIWEPIWAVRKGMST